MREALLLKRGIRRALFDARSRVAEQVKHRRAEGVLAGLGFRCGLVERDAHLGVVGLVFLNQRPIAGGQRDTGTVEDRSFGNVAGDLDNPRIILIAASAIALYHEGWTDQNRVGFHGLNPGESAQHDHQYHC